MLYIIGIGLRPEHITIEAISAIKNSKKIFVENYTSQYSQGNLNDLKKILEENGVKKEFVLLNRLKVEENNWLLQEARKENIALLVFGNPLTATTHIQLKIDSEKQNIETKIIPGISITNLITKSGLDEYRFGRIITICFHEENFEPDSFYKQMKENQKIGLHTLCLLDIKKDKKPERLMNCIEAIQIIEKIALQKKDKTKYKYIALLGLGSDYETIIYGKEKIIANKKVLEIFPQSLIICGKLTEKEIEAIEKN